MDRRVECGKTSNVLEFSYDEGKIFLNVTDAMLENCANCQLYVDDLNDGMHQKLLCMLRENSATPSTSAKHGSALPKKAGPRQAAKQINKPSNTSPKMKRTAAIDTSIAEGPDFSNFYGDEEDPDPDQINEDNGAIEVTRMLEEMESPSRKKLKTAAVKDSEVEEILDNRNWTDSEIKILLDVMEKMLPKFAQPNLPKATLWKKVAVLMKDEKVLNRSDGDCSTKWRNMKARYNQLLLLASMPKNKSSKPPVPWPYMDKMNLQLKNNPTVKLEHVTEVVDGELKESTSKSKDVTSVIQKSKGSATRQKKEDYNERLLAAEIEKGSTLKDLVSAQQERTLVFGRLAAAVEHLAQQAPKK